MATNGELSGAESSIQIQDEEGLVDKRTKEHIINLRIQLDDDERELFVERASDPSDPLSYEVAVQYWAVSVKQYLRAIKRLWNDDTDADTVKNVDYYWNEKQIGESYTLIPPDKDGYQFSMIAQPSVSASELKRKLDLPRDATVPRPEPITFNGLGEVLQTEQLSHTWTVYTSKRGAPPNWEKLTLHNRRPIPKSILEETVEVADNFLQQAGVGFKIGNDLPDWGYEQLESKTDLDGVEVI